MFVEFQGVITMKKLAGSLLLAAIFASMVLSTANA